MSMAGFVDSNKLQRKSFHRRNDSGELDVFEAARYFSGYNEAIGYTNSSYTEKNIMRDHERHGNGYRGRISLDLPVRNLLDLQQSHHGMEKKQVLKDKKLKQPGSPGGRLASFLNSLFNQSASKKKKSKSSSQSVRDEDESPGGRRRRSNSISHFRSSSTTNTTADSKSINPSSSSGFTTPPPYALIPTKACKDLIKSFSDHNKKGLLSLSKCKNGHVVAKYSNLEKESWGDKKQREQSPWLDEKYKLSDGLSEEKYMKELLEEKDSKKLNEMDDGGESDSSSDLFELQNCDLGYYPSGLPVYETTNMDNIKIIKRPISNGPM